MRIVIDYDPDPDFSFCIEEGKDERDYVALCTMLYDDENDRVDRLVGSLSNSVFYADADDWTTGVFYTVEDIPARCEHLREVAREMLAGYVPPLDPLRAAAQAALNYLEDDCEPHWSPEQRSVVETLRAALKQEG